MLKLSRTTPLLTIIATLSLQITGCGGSGGSAPATNTVNEVDAAGLFKSAGSDEELATAIREGMTQNSLVDAAPILDFSPAPQAPDAGLAGDPVSFSTTLLQEAGVDEGDRVKYDGEILYVADYLPDDIPDDLLAEPSEPQQIDELTGISLYPGPSRPVINLYRTDPDNADLQAVGQIIYDEGDAHPSLYIREADQNKQLISISERYDFANWGAFADFSYWQAQRTQINAWSVDNPAAPVEQFSLELEGALLVSRRVDDMLYVITRFSPQVDGLLNYPESAEEKASNAARLAEVPASDLLPKVSRNGQPGESLLSGSDCYIPNSDYAGPETLLPSGSILTLTAIDLNAPDNINSICLNGYSSGYYISDRSLYLTTSTTNNNTLIHKVALNEGLPEYRGSGEVPGYLGLSNPSYMMSEVGDDLRVLSSLWEVNAFPLPLMTAESPDTQEQGVDLYGRHRLTILRENATEARLERIASLPNAERPALIGKPGEDIFAARFLGDRAYVVTFQTIDPLYVIDLSDPQDPKIEGELEIPGFSTYLQPLSDNLLLGVGSDVAVDTPLVQGVKIALFDVGDATNPVELDSAVIGKRGSFSPAMYDQHALTLLQTDTEYRLALPVQRHSELPSGSDPTDPWAFYDWSESALFQFAVDPVGGSITQVGKLVSEQPTAEQPYPTYNFHESRSVIHDDAIYFVRSANEAAVLPGRWGEDG